MKAFNSLRFRPNDNGNIRQQNSIVCESPDEISRKISLIWKKTEIFGVELHEKKVVLKTRDCFPSFNPQNFLRKNAAMSHVAVINGIYATLRQAEIHDELV